MFLTDEVRWTALVERDRAADGAFYYGVTTTRVYCRPGCPSRKPKREHVEFFASCDEAAKRGYRPCKRCKPDGDSVARRRTEIAIRSCRRLEDVDNTPSLAELAAEVGLSPSHFHRLFKDTVGITPKQYAAAYRIDRLRDGLGAGGSVTTAIFDAGFSSSSRAYESAASRLGMTPSRYLAGGDGVVIEHAVARCFLGWVVVAKTARGICTIEFGDEPATLAARLQERFPKARIEPGGAEFSAITEKVVAFIETPTDGLDLPLDIQGTAFQQRVWKAIREIPVGMTASYGELARRIGRQSAVRAVAQACAANTLAVAIPCHRVVRSDGALGGYRWHVERKRALLERERGDRAINKVK